ncbi:MAG TPA: glycoside hydrolase family 31 protein [Advenella sp.]|nr:glycoside hydrolase family 31 protein [Advenella sp.]
MIQFDRLVFKSAHATHAEFSTDTDLLLRVEAHGPGVFRILAGLPDRLSEEKQTARQKQRQALTIAREECIGEMLTESLIDESGWRFSQGDVSLVIRNSPLNISLFRGETCILHTDDSFETPLVMESEAGQPAHWSVMFDLPDNEPVFGLGETAGDFNRRGVEVVSDLNDFRYLPLAWNPRGWGLYANSLERVMHDPGTEDNPGTYQIFIDGPVFDLFLFAGDVSEIFNQYSALTGRAGQPPLWAMGAWLRQQPGQATAGFIEQAEALRQSGFSLDVLDFAQPSMVQFQADKLVLEWDDARMDDARRTLGGLREKFFEVCVPSFPGVPRDSVLFDDLEDRGWLLTGDDGNAFVFDGVPENGNVSFGLLDLTYKDAYAFWVERHHQLVDEGVGAFHSSFPLDIPDAVSARNGESGALLRELYPLLLRRALFDAVSMNKTPTEGVVPSADLMMAVQRVAWQKTPASTNDWDGLTQWLRQALSIQASGVTAVTHDLGNPVQLDGDAPLDATLYLRMLGLCVFSAGFAFQATPALLPDAYPEDIQAKIRTLLELRYRLIPYINGVIEDAVRTGLPVQRMMALAYPDDAKARAWDHQYMLGPALLVAPVLQPGSSVNVYLPEGDAWWDLNLNQRYEGGQVLTVECGLDSVPVFGREGHMLCLGPVLRHMGEFNSARILDEVWMFGMPMHNPVVMRNKIRVMQMQGSSYIKGLEGLKILQSDGLEVKRRGAEVRISRER